MRFRFRTLLIAAVVVPVIIAAAWYLAGFGNDIGNETYRRSLRTDAAIRNELLAHTPPGTPGMKVLAFVLNELEYVPPVKAPHRWVLEYDASLLKSSSGIMALAGDRPTDGRTISVTVGRRITFTKGEECIDATWHFDENDKLSDITVERYWVVL